MRPFLVAALLALGVAVPARAATDNPFGSGAPYAACLRAIDKKAEDAFEQALIWRDHGGGLPAEHCAALALLALDEPGEAAVRLESLARRGDAGAPIERAALLDQSGNAWLLAAQPDSAEAAFSAALKVTPRDPEIWIDRARARAQKMDWVGAEADLTASLTFDKTKPQTYVLRASARAALGRKDEARADIDAALLLDANFPDALVERGAMKLEKGDKAGARADWIRILARAPASAAADSARLRIEQLDVNPDK